jgi:hypothetical protein
VRRHKYDLSGRCACGARVTYGRTKRDRIYTQPGAAGWSTLEQGCPLPPEKRTGPRQLSLLDGSGPVQGPAKRDGSKG